MRRNHLPGIAPLLLGLAAGCHQPASYHSPAPSGPAAGTSLTARSGDVLTAAEIRAGSYRSAYEAIARLRPQVLARRRTFGPSDRDGSGPAVYLDRVHLGSVEVLHSMTAGGLEEVRYLGGTEATHRLGVYHPAGVILIIPARTR